MMGKPPSVLLLSPEWSPQSMGGGGGRFCRAVDFFQTFPAGYVHSDPVTDKPVGDSLAESGLHRQSRAICKCLLEDPSLATCSLSSLIEMRFDLSKVTGAGEGGCVGFGPSLSFPDSSVLWLSLGHWIISPSGL